MKEGVLMNFATTRCFIRPFEKKDIPIFMLYRNNLEWMRYQSFKGLTYEQYEAILLQPLKLENGMQLAIISKESQQIIGDLFLCKKNQTLTIGYTIHPTYANQGYVSEIVQSLVELLERQYPDCEIVAMTDKDNFASKKVLLKNNFEYETFIQEYDSELFKYHKK